MKYSIIYLVIMLFSSCNSNDSEQFIVDTSITISVKDSDGIDLLNSKNSNSLDPNKFKIIYVIDGVSVEFYDENASYPKGFFIYEHENEYRIKIFPNVKNKDNLPITYIKWNEVDSDTLKCEIEKNINSEICKKVWLNDKIVWQSYKNERYFEIIK
ncbi:hypothetical protein FIA58_008775 [Flavobacterium jejuense]|uniref:Lipoprotein n=1 Tax=Flavobacterium jejuense TaxID=1544455 RepID=A0ABX0IUK4_9FLAO|nr:hypothetical protein [Flavobacterium jejuense]NHN25766.1 hypothetical protein [Flavobacterium jejuense]